jgi:hypothetical protein
MDQQEPKPQATVPERAPADQPLSANELALARKFFDFLRQNGLNPEEAEDCQALTSPGSLPWLQFFYRDTTVEIQVVSGLY